jgi:hypothetical protein
VLSRSTHSLTYSLTHLLTHSLTVKLRKEGKDQFVRAIDDAYHVHWIVDNLPVGMSSTNENNEPGTYSLTYSLTHLLTHSLSYSLTHSITYLLTF